MQTVLVEVTSDKAFHLLQELEDLQILRILKQSVAEHKPKLSDKYKGVFSKEDAKSFIDHTQTMRKEWDDT